MLITETVALMAMPSSLWQSFGPWLKMERQKTGVAQQAAADKAGLHVTQISRVENGHSGIRRETLKSLVAAINSLTAGSYRIDVNAALQKAGYSGTAEPNASSGFSLDEARIALMNQDLTKEESDEIIADMELAYTLARARQLKRKEEKP